jgi:serine/threonine protein kinase
MRDGALRADDGIGGRYRVVRVLGRGSFGYVYEAEAIGGGRFAVKVMHRNLRRTRERARFEREVTLLRKLDHDNIVRALDSGFHDDAPFIVFELLPGRTLGKELERVRFMTPSRIAAIARQVLLALEHAHARSIVHRDIKPGNIALCLRPNAVDHAKVLDFGVAKAIGREVAREALTEEGALVGTPGYMAPEQIRGEAIGPRADLFSVGVVIAEALSGERLAGETLIEVVRMHLDDAPIPIPRAASISELGPIVARALEKRPDARYPSACAMRLDLENALPADSMPTAAAGTLLLPSHLESELRPSSTLPLDAPWLDEIRRR